MKTTHRKAVEAYMALCQMGDIRRAPATQIKLFKLKKLLQPSFEFFSEEEKKLVDAFGGTIDPMGRVMFEDKSRNTEYTNERKQLLDLECGLEMDKKIQIYSTELKEISISEMEALEEFVEFI